MSRKLKIGIIGAGGIVTFAHGANLAHFADVVLNGTAPMFLPQQGVDMVKILEALYKSAEAGKEVLL